MTKLWRVFPWGELATVVTLFSLVVCPSGTIISVLLDYVFTVPVQVEALQNLYSLRAGNNDQKLATPGGTLRT